MKIIKSDVFRFIKSHKEQYDFIFADPPYHLKTLSLLPNLIIDHGLLMDDGILVLEHDNQNSFEDHVRIADIRKYGGCMFSFFK